ncbi:hypothetical protein TFLX_00038 [Thermoflexales bacterium]|nr:hypothetical protein TFLX_00038 [Thermoflexales bacterium]
MTVERQVSGFFHVTYIEYDRLDDPKYITYQITGWVPESEGPTRACATSSISNTTDHRLRHGGLKPTIIAFACFGHA